jgi:PhnB protein
MATQPIPDGYHTVTPYLIVDDADGVISFLREAFGAEELMRMNMPDGSVMHAELQLGDSKLMLGGASERWPAHPSVLHLYLEDVDAAYHRALAAGATSVMEPADQFYGDRQAGVRDLAGNQWWIATHVEDVPPDEMQRRSELHMAEVAAAAEAAAAQ